METKEELRGRRRKLNQSDSLGVQGEVQKLDEDRTKNRNSCNNVFHMHIMISLFTYILPSFW